MHRHREVPDLSELSFTFRVDSVLTAAGAPQLSSASISFDPELLKRLENVVSKLAELNASGLRVPFVPVMPTNDGIVDFGVEFNDVDGLSDESVTFDELRVRATGAVELHGSTLAGAWVRADTSIEEMQMVIQAASCRQRRRPHGAARSMR